jgi:hypothetical protein
MNDKSPVKPFHADADEKGVTLEDLERIAGGLEHNEYRAETDAHVRVRNRSWVFGT